MTIKALFKLPFFELVTKAHDAQRQHNRTNTVSLGSLLSVKTGGCAEDCAYCPQSVHYDSGLNAVSCLSLEAVIIAACRAKKLGAHCFCISASGRSPSAAEFKNYLAIICAVKKLGIRVCATLGELTVKQVKSLESVGLDFYNHNIDTSREFYPYIIKTHSYQARLQTLQHLATTKIKICCGVIIGMGESVADRVKMLLELVGLPRRPDVVPINRLIKIPSTPLNSVSNLDDFAYIRMLAVARIVLPNTVIALAAGRNAMSEVMQAWCFFVGANAMHVGEKLLVTPLPDAKVDFAMLKKIDLEVYKDRVLN